MKSLFQLISLKIDIDGFQADKKNLYNATKNVWWMPNEP